VLKKAGYVTGITGKWGLGEPGTTSVPNKKGFDEWLGYLNQARAHSYYPGYIWKNQEKFPLPGNEKGQEGQYVHDLFIDFALDFIRAHRDTTFFLYYSITVPHAKYEIPEADLAPYQDRPWDQDARVHAAMVTRLDREVGQILDLIRALEIEGNTLVFFCSDNGAARRWEGLFDSSGLLRGRKRDLYEGGIRTPMIAWMPGMVPAGTVRDYPWYFADVMATFADVAGVSPELSTDGISVLPVIRGETPEPTDRFMYWEFHEGGFKQAARWKDWKAVRLSRDSSIELYNLVADPAEERDVSGDHPGVVDTLTHYLDMARTPSYHWPIPGDPQSEAL
jgi:arylsulfatase A-like enzyme